MQANQITAVNRGFFARMISWLLAALMTISLVPQSAFQISASADDGGFQLSLSWNYTDDSENNDPLNYTYNSDTPESRLVRLKISYKNNKITQGYDESELEITVPGLKDMVRSGTSYTPIAVAADKRPGTSQKYDWSYSYSPLTDTFKFTNNVKVDTKSTFEGSFEIVWELPSRETVDGAVKTIQAELNTAKGEYAQSNEVTYSQTRTPDEYIIGQSQSRLFSPNGLSAEAKANYDLSDYVWIKYNIASSVTENARAVQEGTKYFELWFREEAYVDGITPTDEVKTFDDGESYRKYVVNTDSNTLENVCVAYSKETFGDPDEAVDELPVSNRVVHNGIYLDDTDISELANTDIEINLADYKYRDIPGPIYDVNKYSFGDKTGNYYKSHCYECRSNGYINALDLVGNKKEFTSQFSLFLDYNELCSDGYDGVYDIEFVDDIMDIQQEDGTLRRLGDDEYHFTEVVIPASGDIGNNLNAFTTILSSDGVVTNDKKYLKADTYDYYLYVRYSGNDAFETDPYVTGKISSNSRTVRFGENENVAAFRLVIKGLDVSVQIFGIKFSYVLDAKESVKTDGGILKNNMFFKLYTYDNEGNQIWTNIFDKNNYLSDFDTTNNEMSEEEKLENQKLREREFERDHDIYGEGGTAGENWLGEEQGVDRECAALHILEIPNQFSVSNSIEQVDPDASDKYYFEGDITASFTYGENNNLGKFSLYTFIPEGLMLSELYNERNSNTLLKEALNFSSENGPLGAYIEDHTTVSFINDYKGTGRQRLEFNFDFSEAPITPDSITVSGIPMYVYRDDLNGINYATVSYEMRSAMLIDQPVGKWHSESYDNSDMENYLWSDINGNGDLTEAASFSYDSVTIKNPAYHNVQVTKFVRTETSSGYVIPDRGANQEPLTTPDGEYRYRLRAIPNNTGVTEFIFFDAIETADGNQWQGEFIGIDYSAAQEVFGGNEPTVYYSEYEETFISAESLKSGNWTTVKPENVRSVAVDFGTAAAPAGSKIYIDIIMKALPDTEIDKFGKITQNEWHACYKNTSDGKTEELDSPAVGVKFVAKTGKITLVKQDSTDKNAIKGAEFELYRMNGDYPNEAVDTQIIAGADENGRYTVGDSGKLVVAGLELGISYYFKEVEAPKGYELNTQVTEPIFIDEDNTSARVYFGNERKVGEFTIKKTSDKNPDWGLSGAEFEVYKSDGTKIQTDKTHITDENGLLTVTGLEWGEYYLKEKTAPDGYELSDNKIEFTVNAASDAGRDYGEFAVYNVQKPASVILTKYEILEDGTQTQTPLSGAFYTLYLKNGTSADTNLGTYKTDDKGQIYVGDLAFGEYYFKEKNAPKGYVLDDSHIEFTLDADNVSESAAVTAYDQRKTGDVTLQKLDDADTVVGDAVYGLFDNDGNRLWFTVKGNAENGIKYIYAPKPELNSIQELRTSSEGYIEIEGLYWGDYYVKEIAAPTGYALNNDEYPITVSRDTVVSLIQQTVRDERLKGKVMLTKYDENETPLSDAVFTLFRNDGSIYLDDLETDADGVLTVEDLDWDSYYFVEKTAPAGYGLNPQKIRFTVKNITAGKFQYFTVTDPTVKGELTVGKKIKSADIVFAHGSPTFTFRADKIENGSVTHTYFKSITFGEDYVKDNTDSSGYVYASVTFADIPVGEYRVTEVDTNRYDFGGFENASANCVIDENAQSAAITLSDQNKTGEVTFVNSKTNQSDTSHAVLKTNIITKAHKLTALIADYTGKTTVSAEAEIDVGKLKVTAVYDDGKEIELARNDYTLSVEGEELADNKLPADANGDIIVTVAYTDGGITRTDSFSMTVDSSDLFLSRFVKYNSETGKYDITDTPEPFTENGVTYSGLVKITGYTGTSGTINFPAALTGHIETDGGEDTRVGEKFKVVGIEAESPSDTNTVYVKNGKDTINSVKFAEGIEFIGESAFSKFSSLNCELKLPDSLTRIDKNAFRECSGLTGDLNIPSKVTEIGNFAFFKCYGFTGSLSFGNNSELTVIGDNAFTGAEFENDWWSDSMNFTGELVIPDKVTSIGYCAFMKDKGFTGSLVIPDSVKTIGSQAFRECTGLNGTLTIGSSVQTIGSHAFWGDAGLNGNLIIPDRVTEIGEQAFYNCSGLTGLDLGKVEIIGAYAFNGCGNLKGDLCIPNSVTAIGSYAFHACRNLTGLSFENGIKITKISDYAFADCDRLSGNLIIPDSVTEIGVGAFKTCGTGGDYWNELSDKGSINLTLPDSLEKINESAFERCLILSGTLTIPVNVTEIGNNAFKECKGLTNLILNQKLVHIGDNAFDQCNNVYANEIIIPASVNYVGGNAFRQMKVTKLRILEDSNSPSDRTIGEQALYLERLDDTVIVIPKSITSIGKEALGWLDSKQIYVYNGTNCYSESGSTKILFGSHANVY